MGLTRSAMVRKVGMGDLPSQVFHWNLVLCSMDWVLATELAPEPWQFEPGGTAC